jgi:hypothetical protein
MTLLFTIGLIVLAILEDNAAIQRRRRAKHQQTVL